MFLFNLSQKQASCEAKKLNAHDAEIPWFSSLQTLWL